MEGTGVNPHVKDQPVGLFPIHPGSVPQRALGMHCPIPLFLDLIVELGAKRTSRSACWIYI